ncbi:DUF416 family protein [Paenarthrobacter sp. NPDC090522]|uniref:DUF416 family protein n=1 Tax=Paenarthrobacter sp. NPDC090522 TaxID=3364383 RepID=UPI0037FC6883
MVAVDKPSAQDTSPLRIDELRSFGYEAIRERLERLQLNQRAVFAAACAQRLWPLYERFSERSGTDPEPMAAILDEIWRALEGPGALNSTAQERAESLIPSEDDEFWIRGSSYAQNAAAAVYYAAVTASSRSPETAAWAATQVYEAADYGAQQLLEPLDLNTPGVERDIASTQQVQSALEGIAQDLKAVEQQLSPAILKNDSLLKGRAWAATLP